MRSGGLSPGVDVGLYLVHSMEPGDEDFASKDREMAETFLAAAEAEGVQRLVYLGGVEPDGHVSAHLRSRLDVEDVLGSGRPELVALRASMVVGAQSDSFRTLAQIVGQIPVLALPSWRDNRTQPIAVADVVGALPADERDVDPGVYNVGGPDEVTIERMCEIIGEELGSVRPSFALPLSSAKLKAFAAATVADSDRAVLEPLLAGMHDDLTVKGQRAAVRVRDHPHAVPRRRGRGAHGDAAARRRGRVSRPRLRIARQW